MLQSLFFKLSKLSLRSKLAFAIFMVLLFSVSLNSTLSYINFEKRLTQTSDSVYQIILAETHHTINNTVGLGLPLASINNIETLLIKQQQQVPGITSIQVRDTQGNALFQGGNPPKAQDRLLSLPIHNAFNQLEGQLALYYDSQRLNDKQAALRTQQFYYGAIWVLGCTLFGFICLKFILSGILRRVKRAAAALGDVEQLSSDEIKQHLFDANKNLNILSKEETTKFARFKVKRFPWLILGLAFILTVLSNLGSSYQSMAYFAKQYQPELEYKSQVIANTLSQTINQVLSYGVPLTKLKGLEQEFAFYTDNHPEILGVQLTAQNTIWLQYPSLPIEQKNILAHQVPLQNNQASIKIISDGNTITNMLKESLLDMVTILIASCLVVTEILLFLCAFTIISPWRQLQRMLNKAIREQFSSRGYISANDEIGRLQHGINQAMDKISQDQKAEVLSKQQLSFVRLPLFLLVFAEASSLSFFPSFVNSFEFQSSWISPSLITSLPISLFMLVWAISLPFAGYWSDKVGRRKAFIVGGVITALGLIFTALAQSLPQLIIIRAFTAVGYGIVFISAQGYVSDTTDDNNRTKGMATFLSAFFSGSLCGAAIGGILAEKLGFSATFLLSALMAIASVILVTVFFEKQKQLNLSQKPLALNDFKYLFSNKYFALISLFSAIPAKIVLTGFLYYICPVYLKHLGESSAASGRIMMAYGLAIIIISPLSAILVDKLKSKLTFVFIGGLLSAIALLSIDYMPGPLGLLAIVIAIGIAHGIGVSPQIPLIVERSLSSQVDKGKIIGIFRLTERIGNVSGPLLAGLCLSLFGFNETIIAFGLVLLASSLALISLFMIFDSFDKRKLEQGK
ncbi:MFS transporter [Motilimonas sp. 1_MG-2023]|uniref:MFS transporter n=1 Tax=Motilimonas sp. 1_MG-2023 TaxID=3062672 RepID=UPI0026E2D702|nr:MFS transporter [Motilimonas sp. 1_MG-2023]MDO6524582.1 MFS transporter [Motilimonas sp. 1_MG-2023]